MIRIVLFFIFSFSFSAFTFFGSDENLNEVCKSDVDGETRNPPLITKKECFDSKSCPLLSEMKRKHYLVLVDTTDGLSNNEIGFLKGDVLDRKTLLSLEPYTKVSVINLNDKVTPSEAFPLADRCRPRSGIAVSPFAADAPHSSQGVNFTKNEFRKWGALTQLKSLESLGATKPANKTLLFEHINAVTTVSKFDFRENDYQERTLVLFSDLMQFSDRIFLRKLCKDYNTKLNCSNFEKFYKAASRKIQSYLDEIKPSFSENSKIIIYHVINKEVRGKPLERNLKGFWTSFFEWAGVKKENIDYRMLFDSV